MSSAPLVEALSYPPMIRSPEQGEIRREGEEAEDERKNCEPKEGEPWEQIVDERRIDGRLVDDQSSHQVEKEQQAV